MVWSFIERDKAYILSSFFQNEYKSDIGTKKLIHDKKENVLMARWRYPSLSLHGELVCHTMGS